MVSVPAKKRLRAVSSRFSIVNSEFGLFFSWGGGGGAKRGWERLRKGQNCFGGCKRGSRIALGVAKGAGFAKVMDAELLWGLQKQ